jgi:hypothetical protein
MPGRLFWESGGMRTDIATNEFSFDSSAVLKNKLKNLFSSEDV